MGTSANRATDRQADRQTDLKDNRKRQTPTWSWLVYVIVIHRVMLWTALLCSQSRLIGCIDIILIFMVVIFVTPADMKNNLDVLASYRSLHLHEGFCRKPKHLNRFSCQLASQRLQP